MFLCHGERSEAIQSLYLRPDCFVALRLLAMTKFKNPIEQEHGMALTPRQRRFVEEYLIDLDARAAARRAGFSARSRSYPSRLMRQPAIARAIAQAMAARAERTGITRERVLAEYARIAFVDLSHLADWDDGGAVLLDAALVSEDAAAAIAAICDDGPAADDASDAPAPLKVSIFDKMKALEALARLLDPTWNLDASLAPPPNARLH
jgi:phage terminase small subunit